MLNTLWSPRQWPQNMLPADTTHPDSTLGATRHSLCWRIPTWGTLHSAFSVPAASKWALNWDHYVVFQLCCPACGLTCYKLALQAWAWSQLSHFAEKAWKKWDPQGTKQKYCNLQLLVWCFLVDPPHLLERWKQNLNFMSSEYKTLTQTLFINFNIISSLDLSWEILIFHVGKQEDGVKLPCKKRLDSKCNFTTSPWLWFPGESHSVGLQRTSHTSSSSYFYS